MGERRFDNENDVGERAEGKGEGKGKGKGKGKQKDPPNLPPSISHTESGSATTADSGSHPGSGLSRLVSSATGLSSGFMTGQGYGQFGTNIMASSKAESSRTNQGSNIALHETAQLTHGGLSKAQVPLGTTFKSPATQSGGGIDEEGFSEFLGTSGGSRIERAGQVYGQSSTSPPVPDAVAAAMNDGSEVVNLLNTESLEDIDDELNMTSEEISALQTALFGEKSPARTAWDDALNFVPSFISSPSSSEDYQKLAEHLGVSDVADARSIWLRQWEGVLSSYTPEVWGDLSPLVTAARQELQTVSTSPEETKHGLDAVRRLRQILAHIRGFPG